MSNYIAPIEGDIFAELTVVSRIFSVGEYKLWIMGKQWVGPTLKSPKPGNIFLFNSPLLLLLLPEGIKQNNY